MITVDTDELNSTEPASPTSQASVVQNSSFHGSGVHLRSSGAKLLQSGDGVSVHSVSHSSVITRSFNETKESCPPVPCSKAPISSPPCSLSLWLFVALVFRLFLLSFSVWQDETRWPDGELRFTDVDYDVFTDAAQALVGGGNPYEARPTYRYSPLIAGLLAPGHWIFKTEDRWSQPNPSIDTHENFFNSDDSKEVVPETAEGWPTSGIHHSAGHGFHIQATLARMWGKLVFIGADLCCACLQYAIIHQEAKLRVDSKQEIHSLTALATSLVAFAWLFNPVTAVVSVRGNVEAVLGMCILSCLYAVLRHRLLLAGFLFGLSIHLKLYPIIYGPAIYLWLRHHHETTSITKPNASRLHHRLHSLINWLPNRDHVIFGLASVGNLLWLTSIGYYYFGGMQFLHQAYFYHFTRVDVKHNFAPHFYPLYLVSASLWQANATQHSSLLTTGSGVNWRLLHRLTSAIDGLTGDGEAAVATAAGYFSWTSVTWLTCLYKLFSGAVMLPAVLLVIGLSWKLYRWPSLCWLVVTHAFVTFNKVCTSQYFLWSLVLLPPTLASLRLPSKKHPNNTLYRLIFSTILAWFGVQIVWLSAAYALEMCTPSTASAAHWSWRAVWTASLLYVAVNVVLLRHIIQSRGCCLLPPSMWTEVDRVKEQQQKSVFDEKKDK